MRVFIPHANLRSSLVCIRSLGRRGIKVTCGDSKKWSIGFYSKYCSKKFLYPDPEKDKDGYKQAILEELKSTNYKVFFPISDETLLPLIEDQEIFQKHVDIPLPTKEALNIAYDKAETLKKAEELKVPIPKTYYVSNIGEIDVLAREISYPVVIKARRSIIWTNNEANTASYGLVENPRNLIEKYKQIHQQVSFPLIQEYIAGPERGVYVLCKDGNPREIFFHKRIRSCPPTGGASTYRESTKPNYEMQEYALALLKALGWHGVAMVEFKLDKRRNNSPFLMEINGRFWGSLALSVASGIDFPYLFYKLAVDGDVESKKHYQTGIRCRYLKGDILHVFLVFLGQGKQKMIDYPSKWKTLFSFFNFGHDKYDVISITDPLPGLIEMLSLFIKLTKGFFKRCMEIVGR